MKQKTLTLIIASIFIIGIIGAGVSAGRILSNTDGIYIQNFVAGDTTTANFSFDYFDVPDNEDNSPLIIKLDLTSEDQINYPVWKSDFEIIGWVDKCTYTILGLCVLPKTIYFDCSEIAPLTINHSIGLEEISEIPDGTFYCYNEEGDLDLNEHDDVFLNIKSHPALWPGQYTLTAEMFYLNDTYLPVVVITNKDAFNRYYRELDNIEVHAEINEINLEDYWGTIFADENITVPYSHESEGTYYFTKILPIDIPEGYFGLSIFAEDSSGLVGSDTTTLKIDITGPVIIAIQPNGSIYEEIIPIELNVTDEKAGVNENSVYYRLREMNGTSICPGSGIGTWVCYDSEWVKIDLNLTTGTYKTEINTTEIGLESGEYWFEVKAEDILGNIGILE